MTNHALTAGNVKPSDRFTNRAPRGGAVSPVNGQFYAGGQFMPMVAEVVEIKPAPLAGSSRQVLWAERLRRQALARLEDEIHVRMLILADPHGADLTATRRGVKRLLIARHGLMTETSAARVIDRRAELS